MPLKFPQNINKGNYLLCLLLMCTFMGVSQTTFTESSVSYGLNIGGTKDGGHAWSDFDGDGDLDVLVLEHQNGNTRSYLMRNNGNNTFTNVRAALVPGMPNDAAERQAAWGDLNNDGRPDFMITSHGNGNNRIALQIYLQNASGTFGNGAGGNNPITVGRSGYTININPINAEGAGFFDFEGDGDLDIFFDSHNHGIELLRNNYIDHTSHTVVNPPAASLFTHITTGSGGGVVNFGLNQFAIDGDFGSAADVNDDGWVDIFMRKREEKDFFLNLGGVFDNVNGADLGEASNDNKGANGLWDLDNDGDLDAVWTENGETQIYRNDGAGIWTALGGAVFPGLPQPADFDFSTSSTADDISSAEIDALAGGDIDNDGDIDILFVGENRSYLFVNQLNSPTPAPGVIGSGPAMSFTLDAETFNTQNGEGTTMIDIDDDGDLDIYMNISGVNRLYINDLPAANRNNHFIIDVTEDRGANGSTGGLPERVAIGTNVLIRDCNGNIISGLRQVNGVYGHGTQTPEQVHFGLPLGENETYVIEIRYPNYYDPVDGITRLIGTIIATPSTISGTNHYSINSTQAELSENVNAPDAVDDTTTVTDDYNISIQIDLFDNDSEPDSENFFISGVVQPATGTVVIDDADAGLVTYSYSLGTPFVGTSFDYTISDSPVLTCPALGKIDTATVTVNPKIPENCSNGIDDDGDGLIDCEDPECNLNGNGYDWYFGQNAGLNFENAAGPIQIASPAMNTDEGSSVWSDDQGNLLFYTDGVNVYNRNHQVMPNGSGLLGNPSSTQSGVVVEDPGNSDRFYIFSIGGNGDRAYSSVVDMTLNASLGDVINTGKNTLIQNVNGEKIAAWPHANGTDIWLVLADINTIYARLISASGIGPAVTTNVASPGRRYGQMKFSPDGQKLAINAYPNTSAPGMVQLLDFDNSTGQFSNLQEWQQNHPYGVEFSPNGNYLYVTRMGWGGPNGELFQYDIANNSTGASIGASGVSLLTGNYLFAQLQIAPDEKIYMATSFTGNNPRNGLAVINSPNSAGTSANAVADQITFTGGARSRSGLPNIPAYQLRSTPFITPVDINQTCFSTIVLQVDAYAATSLQWLLDGVPIAGATGTTFDPDTSGKYQVEVTYGCETEITAVYHIFPDNDNDCVDDLVDLDDDNDGISDRDECQNFAPLQFVGLSNTVQTYSILTTTITQSATGFVDVADTDNNGNLALRDNGNTVSINASNASTFIVSAATNLGTNFDGIDQWTLSSPGAIFMVDNPSNTLNVISNTMGSIVFGPGLANGADWSITVNNITNLSVVMDAGNARSDINIAIEVPCPDTDNDGIPNSFDLDSDGDGCNDVIEAGYTDLNGDGEIDGTGIAADGTVEGSDGYFGTNPSVTDNGANTACLDSDGDGIADSLDLDDDNDGIADTDEQDCTGTTPGSLGTATVLDLGTAVTGIYTDYQGWWASAAASINPTQPNLSHDLLAFEVGGSIFTTGILSPRLLDTDANGTIDSMDSDGNGTADVAVEEMRWKAFLPSNTISNELTLDASNNDGNVASALGNTVVNNVATDPLNPMLYNGKQGLDLGTGMANIGDTWYYNVTGIKASEFNDGKPDILITQVAVPNTVFYTVTLFNAAGNPVGNAVRVSQASGVLSTVLGNYRTDVYDTNGSTFGGQVNEPKQYRIAAIELSEFGLTTSDLDTVALIELEISASADTAFLAYNADAFLVCSDWDSDADGIPNHLDIDSDNDGIYDVVESGNQALDTNGDGVIDSNDSGFADVDQNGMDDTAQSTSPIDTNGDGSIDAIELDADADGCNDVIEAGFTDANADGEVDGAGYATNGMVLGSDGYVNPVDGDANGTFDFQEAGIAPTITSEPVNRDICLGCNTTFEAVTADADTFQWQVFNGSTWDDLTDTGIYSGSATTTLTLTRVTSDENQNQYRLLASSSYYLCDLATTQQRTLTVSVRSVITNRQSTFRVNKN